ncbi:hypothetical protein HPB48_016999 [Haemaphysalis longicornis]|uniref:Uncharacterized protein n=1 Tax=Haemaphysalis longicornis TaxID=44386 RepID=A0A9J6G6E3_HAELO|nr:hypothetical protein HPB48_016999 [Haemaphysalis longicornis]
MLQDDNVGAGFFQRSAAETAPPPSVHEEYSGSWNQDGRSSPYGDVSHAAGWPSEGAAFPAQTVYGGFNYPVLAAAAAASGFDKVNRFMSSTIFF